MTLKSIGWGIHLLAIMALSACGSAAKRAQEAMEQGNYQQAAQAYERILSRNASDADARAGLTEARYRILDQRLIEIRKARLGGNADEAARLLLETIQWERAWNQQPRGAAVATQQEETQYAANHVLGVLKQSVSQSKPLVAERALQKYALLLQDTRSAELTSLKERNRKAGREDCKRLARENYKEHPYAVDLLKTYCAFWGEPIALAPSEKVRTQNLIRELKLTGTVQQLPAEISTELATTLAHSLKQSPWYSPEGGATLNLNLSGEFAFDQNRIAIQQVHTYSETEKYVAYEDTLKSRQVPYESVETVVNPQTGQTERVTRVRYRTETYTEKTPVERHRPVQKSYPYGAWKVLQEMRLRLAAEGALSGHPIRLALSDQSKSEDTAHEIDQPSIGLRPKSAQLPDRLSWLKPKNDQLGRSLAAELSSLWSELYCGDVPSNSFAAAADRVRQCLRLPSMASAPPAPINGWYERTFGLSFKEFQAAIESGQK